VTDVLFITERDLCRELLRIRVSAGIDLAANAITALERHRR